ncbi:tail assembly chaperone [Bacillus phage 019DV002]|nr:tail assembly chaperone [Bacillus phage 019DV002]QFG05253.1 tail assembly chaperone [Bacillus phage 019DV004]
MSNNKPWLKKKTNREITVMGAKIQLKNLSFGEARRAISGGVKINKDGTPDVDVTMLQAKRSLAVIADWDLTDENDVKLPIDLDTLDNLDESFASELIQEVTAAISADELSEDEKK